MKRWTLDHVLHIMDSNEKQGTYAVAFDFSECSEDNKVEIVKKLSGLEYLISTLADDVICVIHQSHAAMCIMKPKDAYKVPLVYVGYKKLEDIAKDASDSAWVFSTTVDHRNLLKKEIDGDLYTVVIRSFGRFFVYINEVNVGNELSFHLDNKDWYREIMSLLYIVEEPKTKKVLVCKGASLGEVAGEYVDVAEYKTKEEAIEALFELVSQQIDWKFEEEEWPIE